MCKAHTASKEIQKLLKAVLNITGQTRNKQKRQLLLIKTMFSTTFTNRFNRDKGHNNPHTFVYRMVWVSFKSVGESWKSQGNKWYLLVCSEHI